MDKILAGKQIYIIEDDVMNLAVFNTSLKKYGAIIEQDVFGFGIVQHIEQCWPVDLVILDILLRRGQNGYEVYDQIRAHPQLKDVPIVAVTSLDPEIEIPKAQAKGFNGFISKPINAMEFPKQLSKVLNGQSVWVNSR
jgi:CheY-like chemotaxis protein